MLLKFLFFLGLAQGLTALKLLNISVPTEVRPGSDATLQCHYDLENSTLKSISWFYRANETGQEQELFRYVPGQDPDKLIYPMDHFSIRLRSSGGSLELYDIRNQTSGFYKCEFTVDGDWSVSKEKFMKVVEPVPPPAPEQKFITIRHLYFFSWSQLKFENINKRIAIATGNTTANLVDLETQFLEIKINKKNNIYRPLCNNVRNFFVRNVPLLDDGSIEKYLKHNEIYDCHFVRFNPDLNYYIQDVYLFPTKPAITKMRD